MVNDVPARIAARLAGTGGYGSGTVGSYSAFSEPGRGIAENVVDGALDVAVGVVLVTGLGVETEYVLARIDYDNCLDKPTYLDSRKSHSHSTLAGSHWLLEPPPIEGSVSDGK